MHISMLNQNNNNSSRKLRNPTRQYVKINQMWNNQWKFTFKINEKLIILNPCTMAVYNHLHTYITRATNERSHSNAVQNRGADRVTSQNFTRLARNSILSDLSRTSAAHGLSPNQISKRAQLGTGDAQQALPGFRLVCSGPGRPGFEKILPPDRVGARRGWPVSAVCLGQSASERER